MEKGGVGMGIQILLFFVLKKITEFKKIWRVLPKYPL